MTRLRVSLLFACASVFGLIALLAPAQQLRAQGLGGPLTIQGLHQQHLHSAAARGYGGVTFGIRNEPALMFQNPASLHTVDGIRLSLGGAGQSVDMTQEQQYAPVRYYPNLSLLLEGLTHLIPDPDTTLIGFSPQDSVQRPFDDIGPNWARTNSHNFPLQAMVAVPIAIRDVKIVGGIGAVEYAGLNHYYQHNNVLSPDVLAQRPLPVLRPTDDNPVEVGWSQFVRSRDGSIRGYGAALAGEWTRYGIVVGVSGLLLDGSSDDFEREVQRGRLTFFSNAFRADSAYGRTTRSGSSSYTGQEFTVGSMVNGRHVSLGFVLKPPAMISRTFTTEAEIDTTGVPFTVASSGEDRLRLPWRGSVGLSLTPTDNFRLGLEYEFRPYDSAVYTDAAGIETSPWVSSSLFRIGGEYDLLPWLSLRGGMRGEADVFVAEGSPIETDPVSHTVYSGGVGISFSGLRFNVAYEYADMKYQDIRGSALSMNRELRHTVTGDISFTIPWNW